MLEYTTEPDSMSWNCQTSLLECHAFIHCFINYKPLFKFYKNEDAKEEGEHPFGGKGFNTILNIGNAKTQYNLLKQCYLHLKEQVGFTEAIDS